MRHAVLLVMPILLLMGCNAMTENAVRANHSLQKMVYNSAERVQGWTEPHRPEERQAGLPETRYCYKSMGDIVCYEQPQSEFSNPLFGYQEGYSAAPMPLAASSSSAAAAQPVMMVQEAPLSVAPPPPVAGTSDVAASPLSEPLSLMPR